MKTCLKILNLFLLGISALAAVLHFLFTGSITESSNLIIYVGASFAIIIAVVLLITTVLSPERKGIPVQKNQLRRGYEPAVTLTVIVIFLFGVGYALVKEKWEQNPEIHKPQITSQKEKNLSPANAEIFQTEDILSQISEDYPKQDVYYKMQETQDKTLIFF